jgi:ketosteroid isomerase-like protein
MSAEKNIQIIKDAYAAFSRGDLPSVFAAFDHGIQWIMPGNSVLAGERNGKEEVAEFFRTLSERWDMLAFEPLEFIGSGDRVVAFGRYEMRSRQTGRTTASHWAMAWTFRDGKAIRFQEYTDTSTLEAAEAA